MDKRVIATQLRLQIPSATLVMGVDRTQLVFPAVDIERKDRPPKDNLNTVKDGPRVVSVVVEQIAGEEARRDHFGHSGIERLSLGLPAEPFAELLKLVEGLRAQTEQQGAVTFTLDAAVDQDGRVVKLARNNEQIVMPVKSTTVSKESEPASRAAGTKRQ